MENPLCRPRPSRRVPPSWLPSQPFLVPWRTSIPSPCPRHASTCQVVKARSLRITIERFWEAGSCPHLFACTADSHLPRYLGELFTRQAGGSQSEHLIVTGGIRALVIAELETESTTIEEIRVNGTRRTSLVHLERGDVLWVPVQPGDVVDLRGYYTAAGGTAPDPWLRNCIIGEFMMSASSFSFG